MKIEHVVVINCRDSLKRTSTCNYLFVQAAYLAKYGLSVAVFEKRHVLGGAAVTEEIIPGYKFSRCSYVLSLLRPIIIKDLELEVRVYYFNFRQYLLFAYRLKLFCFYTYH